MRVRAATNVKSRSGATIQHFGAAVLQTASICTNRGIPTCPGRLRRSPSSRVVGRGVWPRLARPLDRWWTRPHWVHERWMDECMCGDMRTTDTQETNVTHPCSSPAVGASKPRSGLSSYSPRSHHHHCRRRRVEPHRLFCRCCRRRPTLEAWEKGTLPCSVRRR